MGLDLAVAGEIIRTGYYGYKLIKELYDEYLKHSTVKFGKKTVSLEFYLIVKFKRGFQPSVIELENELRDYLKKFDFNPRENTIKIKRSDSIFEYFIYYQMYVELIPDLDTLLEDYEDVEEEDIFTENVANDLTVCIIPKISELKQNLRGEALLRAKEVLDELAKKIQQNFNVLSWNIKLNIISNDKNTIRKLIDKIEKELNMTSAKYTEPEETIDGKIILSVKNVDASFISTLSKILFKKSWWKR